MSEMSPALVRSPARRASGGNEPGANTVRWRETWTGGQDAFSFVLPVGWSRVRLGDARQRDHDVGRLLLAATHGGPVRLELGRQLTSWLQASLPTGAPALEAYLSTSLDGAASLACALTVYVLPPSPAAPTDLCAGLLAAAGPGDIAELRAHDCGTAARLQRRLPPGPTTGGIPVELVQHLFPAPGGGAVLMSASAPLPDVGESLTELFDAIATSFRWLA